MRISILLGSALLLAAAPVRAEDNAKPDPNVVKQIIQRWKDVRKSDQTGYREVLPDDLSAQVRQGKVAAKDKPLAVGDSAPQLGELPAGRPLAVVFYRGHW